MNVREISPNVDAGALLAGAQFIDAFSIGIEDTALDARHAAEKMLAGDVCRIEKGRQILLFIERWDDQ